MKLKHHIAAFAALTLLVGCAQQGSMDTEKSSSTPSFTNQTQDTANLSLPAAPVTPPDARSTNGVPAPPADALAVQPPANTNNADEKK